jgi:hypothetical protein
MDLHQSLLMAGMPIEPQGLAQAGLAAYETHSHLLWDFVFISLLLLASVAVNHGAGLMCSCLPSLSLWVV